MNALSKLLHFEGFEKDWRRLMIQGILILFAGVFMALASVVNPDAIILSARQFSWLPVAGMFILALGIFECLKAIVAKEPLDVVQNLQVGVLDLVVGGLTVLSVSTTVNRLSMMIAAFLLVRGIVRIVFVYFLNLPHKFTTIVGGLVSIVLGILIYKQWPVDEGWFVSFGLSTEIAFRGWAGISFALWIKQQQTVVNE